MNYFQNPYQNNVQVPYAGMYNNTYPNQYNGMYNMQNQMAQNAQQMGQSSTLNGKIVESADMVRVTEVPLGSYGVFPKGDLSEIFIKAWNNDGTTRVVSYKPVPTESKDAPKNAIATEILAKIDALENKLNDTLSRLSATHADRTEIRNERQSNYPNDAGRYEPAGNSYANASAERRE